jgi:urease accessory protein
MRSCGPSLEASDASAMFQPSGLSLQRPAHQRVDGAARLAYKLDAQGRTRLADLYQRAPCRVLFPDVEANEPAQAVMLTTSGGLTGGDRLALQISAAAGTHLTVTTQAAEKLYRALPGDEPTRVDISMSVGESAWAEWLAQETILFDRCKLRRRFVADVARGGRLLAVESLVFGRTAMGEDFTSGSLHDAWRIHRDGRLVWADAMQMQGDVARLRARPFGFGTTRACATLVYVGDDAAALLSPLRERLQACAAQVAATSFDGLLIVRVLAADAADMRVAVRVCAGAIRSLAAGLPERLPKVWDC